MAVAPAAPVAQQERPIIILDANAVQNYEPTQAEIEEYGEWLGMDREMDQDLMWIAGEALKAPLPDHWSVCQAGNGDIFYFNSITYDSIWNHPCDDHYMGIYKKAKHMRDTPTKVVTILAEPQGDHALIVHCKSSLTGEDIASIPAGQRLKLSNFKSVLANRLDVPIWSLRLLLANGVAIKEHQDEPLCSVFGFANSAAGHGDDMDDEVSVDESEEEVPSTDDEAERVAAKPRPLGGEAGKIATVRLISRSSRVRPSAVHAASSSSPGSNAASSQQGPPAPQQDESSSPSGDQPTSARSSSSETPRGIRDFTLRKQANKLCVASGERNTSSQSGYTPQPEQQEAPLAETCPPCEELQRSCAS